MDPKTSACQKLGQLVYVNNGTHILHALDKMNGELINNVNGSDGQSNWIDNNIKMTLQLALQQRVLNHLGTLAITQKKSRQTDFYFDSKKQTDIPAMT